MAVIGAATSFHNRFKFVVEIDGFQRAAFTRVTGLAGEVADVDHFEGGALIPNKSPGRATFPNVTMERGATSDLEMYEWFRQVLNAAANTGLPDDAYKRNLDVVQQDRDDSTLRRWSLFNVYPRRFAPGDWDNDTDEKLIESVELRLDFFEPES